MAETQIEWTDATWNPVAGCSIVTAGCTHCYAMEMAKLCPAAMLFVRCEKGISHSPLENMTELDAGIAIRVLIETILELARREG